MPDYYQLLEQCPPSGGGGCHPFLMRIANAGVKLGLDREDIFADIRINIDDAARAVSDREIYDTIDKALGDNGVVPPERRAGYAVTPDFMPDEALSMLTKNKAEKGSDLSALCSDEIPENGVDQLRMLLRRLYHPKEYLFFGDDDTAGNKDSVRQAKEWSSMLIEAGSVPWPKFIINPLDGAHQPTKSNDGRTTMRGDNNITEHRYCLFEADELPPKEQIKMWYTIIKEELLPVAAVVYSGKKSIHALIRTGLSTGEEWDEVVRNDLYPRVLVPLGADGACKNPARLSRLAGHMRGERMQRLLWIS